LVYGALHTSLFSVEIHYFGRLQLPVKLTYQSWVGDYYEKQALETLRELVAAANKDAEAKKAAEAKNAAVTSKFLNAK